MVCQGNFSVNPLILVFGFENWPMKLVEKIRSSFSQQIRENGELEEEKVAYDYEESQDYA